MLDKTRFDKAGPIQNISLSILIKKQTKILYSALSSGSVLLVCMLCP